MTVRLFLLLPVVLLAGCAERLDLGSPSSAVAVVDHTALPRPERADLFEFNRPYLVGPFDRLTIDVFGVSELSRVEVQIDASGRLSFPLVGVIEASGKTPGELEQLIEDGLRGKYIRNPDVTVNLKETVSQVVTVDGQVKAPGLYPVFGKMTLMRAIATAKGLDEFARLDDVVVFRTVKGQKMAALYNLKAIRRGMYDDPELFANDVVIVGDSKSRRLFKDFLTVAPLLTYPLVAILQ